MQTDWSTSLFPRLLAKALIRWDERAGNGWIFGTEEKIRKNFFARLDRDFKDDFRGRSRTDVETALSLFLRDFPSLMEWYGALIARPDVHIEWREQQPYISPSCIASWEELSGLFDQDALLTFDLAQRFGDNPAVGRHEGWDNWRTVPRVADHELSVMWGRGLSDLHVHAGGVRLPQLAWLDLMADTAGVAGRRALAGIYNSVGRSFERDIGAAYQLRTDIAMRVQRLAPEVDMSLRNPSPERDKWWRWTHTLLLPERRMLMLAWTRARQERALLHAMDRYLLHKHHFFSLVRQPTFGSAPGLRQFDQRYFSALKREAGRDSKRRSGRLAYGSSKRLDMAPVGDACRYLMESEDLCRIELRVAPFERAEQYLRFFGRWTELQGLLRKGGLRIPEIRFAIHFKRNKERGRGGKRVPDVAQKLAVLDRQTAALRLALSHDNQKYRGWMTALSRIDVAGQERDTPLALFTRHLRLLRGDIEAIEYLDTLNPHDPFARWLTFWSGLKRRGLHCPRLDTARLGVTVHAGEDFADLLDGLYQVGSAYELLQLRAGDGIGHGLALTSEFETNGIRDPRFVVMPLGTAHDSLCWLFHFIAQNQPAGQHDLNLEPLRAAIRGSAAAIYGDSWPNLLVADAEDHVWVWRHTTMPIPFPSDVREVRRKLLDVQWDHHILLVREEVRPASLARRSIDLLVLWAQERLLKLISKQRIVVEMNPASNLRISGSKATKDSPAIKLFRAVADGLLACVNTDDPGVFTSCIENEYALLLDGACSAGMPPGEARDMLERVRRIGMELVYWPRWKGRLAEPDISPGTNGEIRDRAY
jgi:adenosine deaminase